MQWTDRRAKLLQELLGGMKIVNGNEALARFLTN